MYNMDNLKFSFTDEFRALLTIEHFPLETMGVSPRGHFLEALKVV
jgi:hypothetical protein